MKHHVDTENSHFFSDSNDPYEMGDTDVSRKKEVRRKLEMRMERRRLKEELEDYEGELDNDFDWDNVDK